MIVRARQTVAEFDEFIANHVDDDVIYEYIGGEIVEVPTNPYASKIGGRIFGEIYIYLKRNDIGHLTPADGGYQIAGERYAPDVSFTSYDKQPNEVAKSGYNPIPPDLAVEVVSSETTAEIHKLRIKIVNYLAEGIVVWVIRPETKTVEIYQPQKPVLILEAEEAVISGGDVLPDFELLLAEIFK